LKKTVIFIAIFSAAVLGFLLVSQVALPDLREAETDIALGENGTVYLISNTVFGSWIYGLDPDMVPVSAYHEISLTKETHIESIAYGDGSIYFIRVTTPCTEAPVGLWELVKTDPSFSGATVLYSGNYSQRPAGSGLTAENGKVYLSFIQSSGLSVSVAALDPESENASPETVLEVFPPGGGRIVDAAYRAGTLGCLLESGAFVQFRSKDSPVYTLGKNTSVGLISAGGPNFFIVGSDDDIHDVSGLAASTVKPGLPARSIIGGASAGDGEFVLLASDDGKVSLVRFSNTDMTSSDTFTITLKARMSFKFPLIVAAAFALLIFDFLFFCSALAVLKFRRLWVRFTATAAAVFFIVFCVITGLTASRTLALSENTALAKASVFANLYARSLSGTDLRGFTDPAFPASAQYAELYRMLPESDDVSAPDYVYVSCDIFAVEGGKATVRISRGLHRGISAAQAYGSKAAVTVDAAVSENRPQSGIIHRRGKPEAIYAIPVASYGNTAAVVVARVAENAVLHDLRGMLSNPVLICLYVLVTGLILIMTIAFIYLRPLRRVVQRMNEITLGSRNLPETSVRSDEITELWNAMKELCVALSIKDYETETAIRSFYRFVPHDLEKLLDRASVMEIELGDSSTISGSVCAISVKNIERARETLNDESFMDFINMSYALISRCVSASNGILLTAGSEFTALKVIFRENAGDGLNFGLDLLGDTGHAHGSTELRPEFFLLLHNTSFLYGMAGSEERAFPLMSSSELSFLEAISEKFRDKGVKIAATEQYIESLDNGCTCRYLGFISPTNRRGALKIYEILDAFSELEKAKRVEMDEKFQEGIRLFYRNDFYLARNAFSAVLKEIPADGVARWYLYACEYYFTNPDTSELRYDLFGIEE
jgi:hypothetical protein